jgi:hypothetical protein
MSTWDNEDEYGEIDENDTGTSNGFGAMNDGGNSTGGYPEAINSRLKAYAERTGKKYDEVVSEFTDLCKNVYLSLDPIAEDEVVAGTANSRHGLVASSALLTRSVTDWQTLSGRISNCSRKNPRRQSVVVASVCMRRKVGYGPSLPKRALCPQKFQWKGTLFHHTVSRLTTIGSV